MVYLQPNNDEWQNFQVVLGSALELDETPPGHELIPVKIENPIGKITDEDLKDAALSPEDQDPDSALQKRDIVSAITGAGIVYLIANNLGNLETAMKPLSVFFKMVFFNGRARLKNGGILSHDEQAITWEGKLIEFQYVCDPQHDSVAVKVFVVSININQFIKIRCKRIFFRKTELWLPPLDPAGSANPTSQTPPPDESHQIRIPEFRGPREPDVFTLPLTGPDVVRRLTRQGSNAVNANRVSGFKRSKSQRSDINSMTPERDVLRSLTSKHDDSNPDEVQFPDGSMIVRKRPSLLVQDTDKLRLDAWYQKRVDGSLWYTNIEVGVPMTEEEEKKFKELQSEIEAEREEHVNFIKEKAQRVQKTAVRGARTVSRSLSRSFSALSGQDVKTPRNFYIDEFGHLHFEDPTPPEEATNATPRNSRRRTGSRWGQLRAAVSLGGLARTLRRSFRNGIGGRSSGSGSRSGYSRLSSSSRTGWQSPTAANVGVERLPSNMSDACSQSGGRPCRQNRSGP